MAVSAVPYLATAAEDIKLWNINSLTEKHQFNPHQSPVTSLSWTRDGNVSLFSLYSFSTHVFLYKCTSLLQFVTRYLLLLP